MAPATLITNAYISVVAEFEGKEFSPFRPADPRVFLHPPYIYRASIIRYRHKEKSIRAQIQGHVIRSFCCTAWGEHNGRTRH